MIAFVLLSMLLYPFAGAGQHAYDYSSSIGVVVQGQSGACIATNNPQLQPGIAVQIVAMGPPQSLVHAELGKPAPDACGLPHLQDSGASVYEIRLTSGSLTPMMPAIAVTKSARPLKKRGALVSGDLSGNGKQEFFRSCTSAEGVHLTVWPAKALKGRPSWHSYYSLGYDMQPTCTSKETADIGG